MLPLSGIRLYIHYPYCQSKCSFCAFPSITNFSSESIYLEALKQEVFAFSTDRPVISIYFGGGSPFFIDRNILSKMLDRLKLFCNDDTEITIELKAEQCEHELLKKYSEIGFNRISIGAQSFIPKKLKMLGRKPLHINYFAPHNVSVSFDIIIGTIFDDTLLNDEVKAIIKHNPDHISIYPLSLEEGSRFFLSPPANLSSKIGQQYERYVMLLGQEGYYRYEASNFFKNRSSICKHNAGYWYNSDFIGFGVGAHSKVGTSSWHNSFSIVDYIDSMMNGCTKKITVADLTPLEYAEQTLLMGLRLTEGVSMDKIIKLAGKNKSAIIAKIAILVNDNLIEMKDGYIKPVINFNFEKCIKILEWKSYTKYSWRTILPLRISTDNNNIKPFP